MEKKEEFKVTAPKQEGTFVQKPSVGRIVHYYPPTRDGEAKVNGNTFVPAIIVSIHGDLCNLRVFADSEKVLWRGSISQDKENVNGYWAWPPKA